MHEKIFMILTNGFDPDVRVFKEAKFLISLDYDVEILCWDRKCDYIEKPKTNIDGVNITRFCIKSLPASGMKQLNPYLKYIKSIKKYLKDKEYKYLYCHDFDGMLAGRLATLGKRKTYIFDMHEIYSSRYKFLVKRFVKKAKNVVYVNNEQLKYLGISENNKFIYLPNYPEESTFLPIEKDKKDNFRINYIGFLRDYDSLKTLMEIAKDNSNINVGIYGTGEFYDKLKEENKYSNVSLYGKFDGLKDGAKIYNNTDILYCEYNPNIYNWKIAYPIKFYEGIVTKTPIIVSKNTKVAEFVEKYKIGEIAEYSNLESLNIAVKRIIDNYSEYVKNIEKIRDDYKWEKIVRNLEKVFNSKGIDNIEG